MNVIKITYKDPEKLINRILEITPTLVLENNDGEVIVHDVIKVIRDFYGEPIEGMTNECWEI